MSSRDFRLFRGTPGALGLAHLPVTAALCSSDRMKHNGRAQRARTEPLSVSGHYIEFRDVSKSFDDHLVLDHVNFFVDPGETCVIMGRSGVGKSVTLKHIMGFLKPDEGRVIVAGEDITDWPEDRLMQIRRRVTMVFQSGALFDSLTVAENIAFPLTDGVGFDTDQIDARVAELAKMLEVTEFLDKLPSELSTGTKRAVAIARALALDPEAILYDEPTTMVDPLMAAHTSDLILKLKATLHKTSVVVTHDTHLGKKIADTLVFLEEGRVAYFGPWAGFEASQGSLPAQFPPGRRTHPRARRHPLAALFLSFQIFSLQCPEGQLRCR